MPSPGDILIHPSQFPESVQRQLAGSLRVRKINHKFLYESSRQTEQWLAVHRAFSPSRTDPDCAATYDRSFVEATKRIAGSSVYLAGLGCGGGQKDTRLLRLLAQAGKSVAYTPTDVSAAMVQVARQAAQSVVAEDRCFPIVCDLAEADDLRSVLDSVQERLPEPDAQRLITFFGMLPNFEPQIILPRLASFLRPNDVLLLSANLAPGPDYAEGVRRVLPLYDNQPTRYWLMTFLLESGFEPGDGEFVFEIETVPSFGGLLRVVANFQIQKARELALHGEQLKFEAGETIRVFYSFRHTPALVRSTLAPYGMEVLDEWITRSGEEGVFLARPVASKN